MLWTLRYHVARAASRVEGLSDIVSGTEPQTLERGGAAQCPLDLGPIDVTPRGGMLAVLRRLEEADHRETGMVVVRSGPT
jgi:hypothetical protein